MPERKRIAHLITRLDLGGAQQNTLFSVGHHDRGRFEVHLVAGEGGILDPDARAISDAGIHLVPWLNHPIEPVRDAAALMRLVALLRRLRVDLLHTHSSKAGILGRFAAAIARVPRVVHTVHGWSFNPTQRPLVRRSYIALERAAGAVTDRFVVVAESDRAKGLAARIGSADRYRLLRSGIEPEVFQAGGAARSATRGALGYGPEHRVVGTVACLKPQKAPLDFVRMAEIAFRRDPSLRFVVAGDGELRPQVEREIASRGLGGIVRLLGWRRDIPELLHAMDAFVLTSLFEGLPRSVVQAMAAGTPVVATAADGTSEVVIDRVTGRLAPTGRPDAIAEALLETLGDRDAASSRAGRARERIGSEFDIRDMVRALDGLYSELLKIDGPTSLPARAETPSRRAGVATSQTQRPTTSSASGT